MANLPMDIPLMTPPAGHLSDFAARDLQPTLVGVHATFLSLAVIIVALRFYVRGIVTRNLWWEDFMVLVAAIATVANSALIFTLLDVGYGRHAWNIPLENILAGNALRRLNAVGIPYPLVILFIKLSVALLYWRIFKVWGQKFRLATLFIMACCVIFYLGIFAYTVAIYPICIHIDNALSNANCGTGTQVLTWTCGIGNVVTDIYLLILPIPPLARLEMSRKKKVAVWIIFSAGGIATAASVARLAIAITLQGSKDYLYIAAVENVPTTIEMCVGIIAASIPTLGQLRESQTWNGLVSRVLSYASTLSLVRRSSASASDVSIRLSVQTSNKNSGARTTSAG